MPVHAPLVACRELRDGGRARAATVGGDVSLPPLPPPPPLLLLLLLLTR